MPAGCGEGWMPVFRPYMPSVWRGRLVVDVPLPGDGLPGKAPRCGLCGRVLRSEASRAAGVGPVCLRRSRDRTAARTSPRSIPATESPQVPGQTELPLLVHQPTLWPL